MIDVREWLQRASITPRDLVEELGLSRAAASALFAGKEPDKLVRWAMEGLASKRAQKRKPAPASKFPVAQLARSLADERWAGETARLAMPVLIGIARSGKSRTITYGDLHQEVIRRGGKAEIGTLAKYAHPCGRIAYACEDASDLIGDEVPPLTAIVVNGTTGLPSRGVDGFLRGYLRSKNAKWTNGPEQRRHGIEQIWQDIFAYQRWDEVQAAVGLSGDPNFDR
ncbi:MAG: hypothetical protein QOH47_2502 [Sphingomonadales bacterium]|nr:hypothetical protein [Sphingomonadales bacterium]